MTLSLPEDEGSHSPTVSNANALLRAVMADHPVDTALAQDLLSEGMSQRPPSINVAVTDRLIAELNLGSGCEATIMLARAAAKNPPVALLARG